MLIRIELLGHVLHFEVSKPASDEAQPSPVDTQQPLIIYHDENADPVGFHLPPDPQ